MVWVLEIGYCDGRDKQRQTNGQPSCHRDVRLEMKDAADIAERDAAMLQVLNGCVRSLIVETGRCVVGYADEAGCRDKNNESDANGSSHVPVGSRVNVSVVSNRHTLNRAQHVLVQVPRVWHNVFLASGLGTICVTVLISCWFVDVHSLSLCPHVRCYTSRCIRWKVSSSAMNRGIVVDGI